MKTFFAIIFLALPLAAQTRAELDSKYGPSEDNQYRIKPGIALEVTFSESEKVKQFRVVPYNPKDKNALLNSEEARKVIWEIAGSRFCRPESSKQIDVPCPPRNGCRGLEEIFRSVTSLMVWYKKSLVYALVTLNDENSTPPPGNIQLLPGYEHIAHCSIDTAGGEIKKVGGIEIHYDIGAMAGNFARQHANSSEAEWIGTEQVDGDSVLIVLTKQRVIYATFQKSSANFSASVGSQQSNIDDFLKMVFSYHPN
jgi:hypothetical protein